MLLKLQVTSAPCLKAGVRWLSQNREGSSLSCPDPHGEYPQGAEFRLSELNVLAVTNTAWQTERPLKLIPVAFVNIVVAHTGQSSQLFSYANHGNDQFLPMVTRNGLV